METKPDSYPDLPSYKNPPVIEVVSGISFDRLENFKLPHFGQLWEIYKKEYPVCENASPLDIGLGLAEDPSTGLPLPRVWFINKKSDKLIQIQLNRFLYNWRKMEEKHTYPSFPKIKVEFHKNFELFLSFLEKENITFRNFHQCELTYINHIPKGQGWESIEDIQNVFPDITWRSDEGRFLKKPLDTFFQTKFKLPEDKGHLNVKYQHVHRKIDKTPLLVLEISARGLGGDKSPQAMSEWFELAHEWIVKGFEDITDLEIQKKFWKKYVR